MELTTSYQKIAESYVGYSAGNLYVRAYAMYTAQDIANNRSYVYYKATAYFDGGYIYDQNGNGSIGGTGVNTRNGNISNVSGEITIAETEGWITHDIDGTKSISVVAKLNFPNWGWYATATGNATLPSLHKPPLIQTADMVETNATMTALSIPDTTIVRHLSQKTITLHATAYDDATVNKYRLRHLNTGYDIPSGTTFQNSNVFTNVDYTTHDISITDGKANIIQDIGDSLNGLSTDWVYVSISGTAQKPDAIPYVKPTLVGTSTTIKRKSGSGVNLTDNKVSLNLTGTIYKANDIIGNDNAITQVGYKIWDTDSSEPANYTTITATLSGGDVSVSNLEISNVLFTKVYNYKIILQDKYYNAVVEGIVPLGQSLWTEYKNRVDFLRITRQGNDVYSNTYSTSETIVGTWTDGNPIYRKVLNSGSISSNSSKTINIDVNNIDVVINISGTGLATSGAWLPISRAHSSSFQYQLSVTINTSNQVLIETGSSVSLSECYVIIEYTKT